jgi:hypothetical protein
MTRHDKQRRVTLAPKEAELARKFFRVCTELFGDGCTVTVRKTSTSTDAAPLVQRGQHLTQPST